MGRKNEFTQMVDTHVGLKVHELRIAMGLSRQQLAEKIGITHQQLQKYEKGTNRITIGRLAAISKALGRQISYFTDDIENEVSLPTSHQRMAIEVSRNFLKIKNPNHQNTVNLLVRSLGE